MTGIESCLKDSGGITVFCACLFIIHRFHEAGIKFITDLIADQIQPKHGDKGKPVPLQLQVLMTLQYLASNTFELHIGSAYNVGQTTVSLCINRVCAAIAEKAGQFVHLPSGQELAKTKANFFNYCGIPYVLGAIDCSHIRIQVKLN
jgi:hypothetical protein